MLPTPGRRGPGRMLVALAVSAGLLGGVNAWARGPLSEGQADLPTVALKALPREAQLTHQRIHAGGPFPYAKDGSRFGNRERLLPGRPRGYYREYTVETPGSRDRGARRIVCGGREVSQPEACYYTGDHYASFRRIEP